MQPRTHLYANYIADIKQTLDRLPLLAVESAVKRIVTTWRNNGKVFIMGNGGSAATALHMACDLSKNTATPGQRRLRALSLNDNMALFSALSNDCQYENVFAEQIRTLADVGDVVIAISASGNSANILNGVQAAHELGVMTIGFTGYHGGKLAGMVDIPIVVPSHNIEQIEDVHMMLEHIVTVAVRESIQQSVALAA
jgi:D-sedoheptulose 7-phosphate isomerase